jgi:hypothetical protein
MLERGWRRGLVNVQSRLVLVRDDADGQVWLGYNDPAYIAARHAVPDCPSVAMLSKALAGLAAARPASALDGFSQTLCSGGANRVGAAIA